MSYRCDNFDHGVRVVIGSLLLAAVGCSTPTRAPDPTSTTLAPTDILPLESRIDAFPGRTLVIPVRAGGAAPASVPITLDDGRALEGRLWRLTVEFPRAQGLSWLPPAGVWKADAPNPRPNTRPDPAPAPTTPALASWAVAVDLPLNIGGHAITISGTRVRLNVLPPLVPPGAIASKANSAIIDPPQAVESPSLTRLLEPERTSPVRRWRSRLYHDGLADPAPAGSQTFDPPILEALARQGESRWSWALRSLSRTDAALARRLARRLVAITTFGAGITAPTWPTSQADLDALLTDLLDPALDPPRRAERATAFLSAQPEATAWVIDDAGLPDATSGRPTAVVGIANLTDRAVLAVVASEGKLVGAEPVSIAPAAASNILVPTSAAAALARESSLAVVAGPFRTSLRASLSSVPATPPGLTFGPLTPDYTLESWIDAPTQGGPPIDPAWATVALLFRRGSEWTLHIECARPGDSPAASEEDTIRLWIGPTARPRLILRIGESGYAHAEQFLPPPSAAAEAPDPSSTVTASSQTGKWICQVPIPAWCIEPDGTLRLGLERTDARATRSAFPRPMLPWQTEPGRITVNTHAWDSAKR